MVTRIDVARHAGVSAAVVSYVVNDGPRPVAPQTRAKVEAAIAALGYRPNVHAAALKGGKTKTVAVLLPSLTNPFFAEFAELLGKALFEARFQLSVSVVDSGTSREKDIVSTIVSRGVDAVVFSSAESIQNTSEFMNSRVKSILFNSEAEIPEVFNVVSKNISLASAGVQYLHSLGHSLIGVVAGQRHSQQSKLRVRGWRQEQEEAGFPYGPELVVHSDLSSAGAFESTGLLLDPDGPAANKYGRLPSALMVASDVQAFGVILRCAQMGIRVPKDLQIVSIDGTQIAKFSTPPLTTIRQPLEYMCDEIVAFVTGKQTEKLDDIHGNLIVGGTTTNTPLYDL